MGKVVLDWKTAENFIRDAFIGVGVPEEDAKIVVDVLLESDRPHQRRYSEPRNQL